MILSSDPFPLLLPVQAEARRAVASSKYGLLSVTRDGRLMRWRDELHGASELCPGAPPGAMMGFHVDEESGFVFYVTRETRGVVRKSYPHLAHVPAPPPILTTRWRPAPVGRS